MSVQLTPHFGNVQAHYDLSDDFFRLFLDPTQTYSCAYFERDDMTLQEAQIAKIDLALGKLNLEPGMTLLDIGCGWGATMRRAIEKYDVNVVGLTLSENQAGHVQKMFDQMDTPRSRRVLLEGWEKFDEPVDRIVSIGAFEHFGHQRYHHFFEVTHRTLPADGKMLLHTIVRPTFKEGREKGLTLTHELVHFTKFILAEIFPGGWLPSIPTVHEYAEKGRLPGHRGPVIAAALRQDAGHVGHSARGQQRSGHRDPVADCLRPLHEVPDRLREAVPPGLHRRRPVHTGKVTGQSALATHRPVPGRQATPGVSSATPGVLGRRWATWSV